MRFACKVELLLFPGAGFFCLLSFFDVFGVLGERFEYIADDTVREQT